MRFLRKKFNNAIIEILGTNSIQEPISCIHVIDRKIFLGTLFGRIVLIDEERDTSYKIKDHYPEPVTKIFVADNTLLAIMGNKYYIKFNLNDLRKYKLHCIDKRLTTQIKFILSDRNLYIIPTSGFSIIFNISRNTLNYSRFKLINQYTIPMSFKCINEDCYLTLYTHKHTNTCSHLNIIKLDYNSQKNVLVDCVENYSLHILSSKIKLITFAEIWNEKYLIYIDNKNFIYMLDIKGDIVKNKARGGVKDIIILNCSSNDFIITIDRKSKMKLYDENLEIIRKYHLKPHSFLYNSKYVSVIQNSFFYFSSDFVSLFIPKIIAEFKPLRIFYLLLRVEKKNSDYNLYSFHFD